jgi:hypothetical protein
MTAREKTVLRAIARALRGVPIDMNALATSYAVPDRYTLAPPKGRAVMMIDALIEASDGD